MPAVTIQQIIIEVVLLFSRVGACLMLAPGFSSPQIPMQVRLFVALAVTFAMTPLSLAQSFDDSPLHFLRTFSVESSIGALIGLTSRAFFLSLETIGFALATMLGLANPFGVQVDANQTLPPIASFIVLTALALIFFTDLHLELIRGLVMSYRFAPLGGDFDFAFGLHRLVGVLSDTLRICLRICSPFFLYAMITNLAAALINRLTPQIGVFYISAPFVICGGLLLFYFVIGPLLGDFINAYGAWLVLG